MTAVAALRRLASLSRATDSETAFGGRARSWDVVATLWVAITPGGAREAGEAGSRPLLIQPASAEARDLAAADRGQRLSVDGVDWRVVSVAHAAPRPGRMTLSLDRDVD